MAIFNKKSVMVPLVILGASLLRKKENREKLKGMWQDFQKLVSIDETTYQRSFKEYAETAGSPDPTKIRENNFISEGGSQTAIAYYNENKQKVK